MENHLHQANSLKMWMREQKESKASDTVQWGFLHWSRCRVEGFSWRPLEFWTLEFLVPRLLHYFRTQRVSRYRAAPGLQWLTKEVFSSVDLFIYPHNWFICTRSCLHWDFLCQHCHPDRLRNATLSSKACVGRKAFHGISAWTQESCALSEKHDVWLDLITFVCNEEQHTIEPQWHPEQGE